MELRTLENEIDALSTLYERLRCDTTTAGQRKQLPPLQFSTTTTTTATTTATAGGGAGPQSGPPPTSTTDDGATDTAASAVAATAATTTARSRLQTLQSIRGRLTILGGSSDDNNANNNDISKDDNKTTKLLRGIIPRIQKRMATIDPVTEQPRYGTKTMERIQLLLNRYTELCQVLDVDVVLAADDDVDDADKTKNSDGNGNSSTNETNNATGGAAGVAVSQLLNQLEHDATKEHETEQRQCAALEETARREEEQRQREREAIERQRQDAINTARQQEEEERQERARLVREQLAAQERERRERDQRDQEWVSRIEQKGTIDGVRLQLERLLQSTATASDSHNIQKTAITALCTIFTQIVRYPEEIKYRRIRRNHPQFVHDIGQYDGGAELLIAAGFTCGHVVSSNSGGDGGGEQTATEDGVPTFICNEPNLEQDMDAWAAWFDLLKATHSLLTEQQQKL